MSRISQAQTLIRSLNPTPLRTSNSQQLNAALENISNRAFPNPSNIAAGSREEKALDGMIKSLERLRAGQAMSDVSLFASASNIKYRKTIGCSKCGGASR
jgi:hypothetical protein